jgi:hypothetical protein
VKRLVILAGLLLAALPVFASSETLDPNEPITLELREAKLKDVITTLGAIANLAVVIEPGIEGKVTIKLQNVPFVKVLAMLARDNGISLRIEDGKLVASRVQEAPTAVPALPENFRNSPRILLTDYAAAAAAPQPLLITTTHHGEELCSIARIGDSGGGVLEVSLSRSGGPEGLVVADLGYDPVLRMRSVALESEDGRLMQASSLTGDDAQVSVYKASDGRPVRLMVSQSPKLVARLREKVTCSDVSFQPFEGGTPVSVAMQASALAGNGVSSLVFAPRIQAAAGTVFKALGSEADSGDGQLRGYAVTGYVSRDGKKVALAFKARTVWTDPADGRQYYFTQAGSQVGFLPLKNGALGGFLASSIPAGVATARPLELRVFGQE